jgi:hypothetical protein
MGAGRLLFSPAPWLQTRLQINQKVLKSKPKYVVYIIRFGIVHCVLLRYVEINIHSHVVLFVFKLKHSRALRETSHLIPWRVALDNRAYQLNMINGYKQISSGKLR